MTAKGPIDTLQTSTAATVRALAKESIGVAFGFGKTTDHIALPLPAAMMDDLALASFRSRADQEALKHLYAKTSPGSLHGQAVYFENTRLEALSHDTLKGISVNADGWWEQHLQQQPYHHIDARDPKSLHDAVQVYVRQKLTDHLPPAGKTLLSHWQDFLDERILADTEALKKLITKPTAFHQALKKMMEKLHLPQDDVTDDDSSTADEHATDEQTAKAEDNAASTGDKPHDKHKQQESFEDIPPFETLPDQGQGSGFEMDGRQHQSDSDFRNEPYHVYTYAFDEMITAEELADRDELSHLRQQLDEHFKIQNNLVSRLASKLQQQLLATQARAWDYNLDDGFIDSKRLAGLIANPNMQTIYKRERQIQFKDTVVTILLDNSGSMRGRPIILAALSADVLAKTLERCGVRVEILGFTTKMWKGGKARELWAEQGKPLHPGRLNDLRHIIYKSADVPYVRARKNLGLMLREGILKENIDGEALLWAHQRLLMRPEARKILMVISDGAPVDDATLSANIPLYLENHLKAAVEYIESLQAVELTAIGIGHDVTKTYQRSITINEADELAPTMIAELSQLFKNADQEKARLVF